MIEYTAKEVEFLKSHEGCRMATSHNDIPHVKPVSYLFENNKFFIATDYETRTFKNLRQNDRVSLVVDVYKDGDHKAILIQGTAKIIEGGKEFFQIYKKFYDRFEWVRREPWDENEAPFIEINPTNKTSWGIK